MIETFPLGGVIEAGHKHEILVQGRGKFLCLAGQQAGQKIICQRIVCPNAVNVVHDFPLKEEEDFLVWYAHCAEEVSQGRFGIV